MATSPKLEEPDATLPDAVAIEADADAEADGGESSPDLPALATPASAAIAAAAAAGGGGGSGGGSSGRRLPPPCWTHEETLALIEAYRDKWQALRRGNLRAADWDAVAAAVTSRCSRFPTATPKTGVQCRHKIEKLRKRYRAERLRALSRDPTAAAVAAAGGRISSPWPFFPLLHDLAGPTNANPNPNSKPSPSPPIHRRGASSPPSSPSSGDDSRRGSSLHHLISNGGNGGGGSGLRFTIPKASRSKVPVASRFVKTTQQPAAADQKMRQPMMQKPRVEEGQAFAEVAAAIRAIGDGYLRMEERKMEMAREMEKERMEAELRRTEMILDMQRNTVDAFVKGFLAKSKKKRARIAMDD